MRVPTRATDQGLYAAVLVALYGLIVLLLFQLNELSGSPSWENRVLALGWAALLVLFFTWAPSFLLHGQVSQRDLLPAGVLTAVGLVAITLVSRWVVEAWINLYASDYGGLGVVLGPVATTV